MNVGEGEQYWVLCLGEGDCQSGVGGVRLTYDSVGEGAEAVNVPLSHGDMGFDKVPTKRNSIVDN